MITDNNDKIMIKEFFITNLYEEKNVHITFDSPYKILVAENGCGKTTILNVFYALLSGDVSKLSRVSFEETGLMFSDNEKISFKKHEFNTDSHLIEDNPLFMLIANELGNNVALDLINEAKRTPIHRIKYTPVYSYIEDNMGLPYELIMDELKQIKMSRHLKTHNRTVNKKNTTKKIEEKFKKIRNKLDLETLYLPTYRRVEEDIREFGRLKDSSFKHSSIKFGIEDVKDNINKITSKILQSSAESFLKINGQILNQLIDGFDINEEMRESVSDPKSVKIVLDRIEGSFTEDRKQQILGMVESKTITNKENDALVYFLSNLLEVYKKQQDNDEAIKNFTKYCNKYLVDKQITYDESAVKVAVYRKKSKKEVSFESLSSGEKQIISLFSILYLQKKNDLAIFFDEPELSLSIEWQKTLLPDIIESGKCKFLFATTHSPFIFENALQKHTVDLLEYIEEL